MLLAIDIGNTHTVLGLYQDEELRADWRIATRKDSTADEMGVLLRSLFHGDDLDAGAVGGVIISSVVPDINGPFSETSRRYFGVDPLFVGLDTLPADLKW